MDDLISRKAAIDAFDGHFAIVGRNSAERFKMYIEAVINDIRKLPPAQQNLSEEYAKAVRNWLVNYQIKCAELNGRYTPYEVLGWIVSDWRKENGIW